MGEQNNTELKYATLSKRGEITPANDLLVKLEEGKFILGQHAVVEFNFLSLYSNSNVLEITFCSFKPLVN